MPSFSPIPSNELSRFLELAELDLTLSNLNNHFKDLTRLAAGVAGTEICLINLIDSYQLWSVANHGLPLAQMSREDSVCQYTLLAENYFEIPDLAASVQFKDQAYVKDGPKVRYYFGIPLRTKNGHNLGTLCVLDKELKNLPDEKIELLKIIAAEIVNRLLALQTIYAFAQRLKETQETKKRVMHDIRGPINGIIGLVQMVSEKGEKYNWSDVQEFMHIIQKSGSTLLQLADNILNAELKTSERSASPQEHALNILPLQEKLEQLYRPQALAKEINFTVTSNSQNGIVPLPENILLQITGNLISNALKFTPAYGQVTVHLDLILTDSVKNLRINVSDSGTGLTDQNIATILNGTSTSTNGTQGERGYGLGLPLIKHLIDNLHGTLEIYSKLGAGTTFDISIPIL